MDSFFKLLTQSQQPVTLSAEGRSMAPLIEHGAQISIMPTPASQILIGDIVAFQRNNALICHRIVGRWQWGPWLLFFEKGERVRYGRFLKPTAIIGKVIAVNHQPLNDCYAHLSQERLIFLVLSSLCAVTLQTIKEFLQQRFCRRSFIKPLQP